MPIEATAQSIAAWIAATYRWNRLFHRIGYGEPPQQTKSFAAETAALTGITKQAINRHITQANALGNDLDCVVETKGSQACAQRQRNVKLTSRLAKPTPRG